MSLLEREPPPENQNDYPDSDSDPHDSRPRWDVIIITGIAAMMLVIFGGLLLVRARESLNSVDLQQDTATPQPVPTTMLPVLALEIPQQSVWSVQVEVEKPDGTREVHLNSGSGRLIIPPRFEMPSGSRTQTTISFELIFTLPDFLSEGGTTSTSFRYDRLDDYLDALSHRHYALYDSENRFLGIRAEADVLDIPGIETQKWNPEVTSTSDPTQ